jgi:phosphoribosylamine---glycine ligase
MKLLLIGSGGREHALAWKLAASPSVSELLIAPGNPGMEALGTLVPVKADDVEGLAALARARDVGLVVVGPEAPLAAGLADRLTAAGIPVFGPSAAAAQLEASKAFTKAFCVRHAIPTAGHATFGGPMGADEACAHLATLAPPFVIKADGLAAGKGVVIAATLDEARTAVRDMLDGRFGAAGASVVIEEFMEGEEVSLFFLCDGVRGAYLGAAQDHKRAFDGDTGPNTGGMGAYSPASIATDDVVETVQRTIIAPTLAGMAAEGAPFTGVLYAGLMLTAAGPKLVEFNARFGDPECQVLMARFEGDLAALLLACARGDVRAAPPWSLARRAAALVVLAAQGYPDAPLTGSVIRGLPGAAQVPDGLVFHAGTRRDGDGTVRAAGGRVLNAVGVGADLPAALAAAYGVASAVDWPGGFYRSDIGWRELARLRLGGG